MDIISEAVLLKTAYMDIVRYGILKVLAALLFFRRGINNRIKYKKSRVIIDKREKKW